jgi:spermidine/putrescine transport system substrate-binding protein
VKRRTFVGGLLGSAGLAGCGACSRSDRRELVVYNWSDYIDEHTVEDFSREHDVDVRYLTYESPEELLGKLQAGASGYDVIFPSGYAVELLVSKGQLLPLDMARLPNRKNLQPRFLDEPNEAWRKYAIPYAWGTIGLAWRSDLLPTAPDSWGVFLDPALAGKTLMTDDPRLGIGTFLKLRGRSINSVDPAEIEQAKQDAIAAKRNIQAFVGPGWRASLLSGDAWIAQAADGDVVQVAAEQPAIKYVVPREGTGMWVDYMVIPTASRNQDLAHAFIDFVLRPQVAVNIASATGFATPNAAAAAMLPPSLAAVPEDVLAKCEVARDLGAGMDLWDRAWTEVKNA